ncbi:MAG: GAF domain-containing protein [Anaerolineales bacterium]
MLWKSLSLRWRMTLLIVLIPLVLLMPGFVAAGVAYRHQYREARLSKARMVTFQLEQTLADVEPYVSSVRDLPDLNRFLKQSIADQPEMAFAAVVLDNGLILYHSLPGVSNYPDAGLLALRPEADFQHRQISSAGLRNLYVVSHKLPLAQLEDHDVYAVVGLIPEVVDPPLLGLAPPLMGVALAALLGVLLQLALGRLIFSPIQRLAEGAAIIGAGDLQYRIAAEGRDEVSFLAQRFNDMADRLGHLVVTLEEQVAQRTAALAERSQQFEAVAKVSGEAVNIRSVPLLLETTVNAISEHFGYYHAGIFLTDEDGEWALLSAASSAGGQQMLARRHRLRVGRQGIVGAVIETGRARIALDVGADAVWFDTPELPETRSEIALPLKDTDGRVVGALDVQSRNAQAFNEQDVEVLQLLADQVSVALQNARLLERTRSALDELSTLQHEETRQGWARVVNRLRPQAYEYDRVSVNPVLPMPMPSSLAEDSTHGTIVRDGNVPMLVEPMRYRGQTLGVVALSDAGRLWTEEEMDLVESVSDQIAVALENARLFEEAQRNARHQALLNYVLNAAASTSVSPEEALGKIAGILAQGLGMAVGIFTFVKEQSDRVQLQSFIAPDGAPLLSSGETYNLTEDLRIFFRGLDAPALSKMLPFIDASGLDDLYELDRVLYVVVSTATTRIGFIAMVQRKDDILLDPETRALARSLAQQVGVVIENLRLLEETQRRSAELQALYQVSLQLGEELDVQAINRLIVEQAVSLFDAESCGFFIHDQSSDTLVLQETVGSLVEYSDLVLKPGEGLSGTVLMSGELLRIASYSEWQRRVDEIARSQFGPALGVPLSSAEGVRGVLFIAREVEAPLFDDADVRLAELFASQAAVALESARLYEENVVRAQNLQQLYEAGLDLVSRLDAEEVLTYGADWARRLLGGAQALIFYWNDEQSRYLNGISVGEEYAAAIENVDIGKLSPRAGGITETIEKLGEAVIVNDTSQDPRVSPKLVEYGMLAQIGAPLRFGRRTQGVIYVNSEEAGHFSTEDVQLLEFLGSQIATALENSMLFSRTETALNVVAEQARSQSNVAQATSLLSEQGAAALGQVLGLLGETAEVSRCIYFQAVNGDDRPRWVVERVWSAPDTGPLASTAESFPIVEDWKERLDEEAIHVRLSDASPEAQAFLEAWRGHSLLGLAVAGAGSDLPGLLAFVDTHEERIWEEEQIAPLRTVATAITSTLARERLFQQVQEALAETEALYEAGTALNTALDYGEILDTLRTYTSLGQGVANISVQIFNRPWSPTDTPEWVNVMARWPAVEAEGLLDRYPVETFPSIADIMAAGELVIVEEVETDPRLDEETRRIFSEVMGARSTIFIPLFVAGRAIGFVNAVYPERLHLREAERRRLASLAGQAAVAIQNQYQIRATAARARREQLIREIVGQIQAAPDVQGVLETATRELGRALRVPRTTVRLSSSGERQAIRLGTGPLVDREGGDGQEGAGRDDETED